MGWSLTNNINKGYFRLIKNNKVDFEIDFLVKDININDYYIIKATRSFKMVDIYSMEKYANILFINKNIYDMEYINLWFNFIKSIGNPFPFLDRPFPPEYMIEKIKVVECYTRPEII